MDNDIVMRQLVRISVGSYGVDLGDIVSIDNQLIVFFYV